MAKYHTPPPRTARQQHLVHRERRARFLVLALGFLDFEPQIAVSERASRAATMKLAS